MSIRKVTLPVNVLMLGPLLASPARAQTTQSVQVAGTAIYQIVEYRQVQVGGSADHLAWVMTGVGSNTTDQFSMHITDVAYGETARDVGVYKNFYTSVDAYGTLSGMAEGKCALVMVGGKPMMQSEGTWEWTGGTGRYANVRGKGTFTDEPRLHGTIISHYSGSATGF